jgi:hypothetical protein
MSIKFVNSIHTLFSPQLKINSGKKEEKVIFFLCVCCLLRALNSQNKPTHIQYYTVNVHFFLCLSANYFHLPTYASTITYNPLNMTLAFPVSSSFSVGIKMFEINDQIDLCVSDKLFLAIVSTID